jgi:hypothetical protein
VDIADIPQHQDRNELFYQAVNRKFLQFTRDAYHITGVTILPPHVVDGEPVRQVRFHLENDGFLFYYQPFAAKPEELRDRYWRPPVGVAKWRCRNNHKWDLFGTPGTRKMRCVVCENAGISREAYL